MSGRPDTVFGVAVQAGPPASLPAGVMSGATSAPGPPPPPPGAPVPPPPRGGRTLSWAQRSLLIRTIARHELTNWPEGCDLWSLLRWSAGAIDAEDWIYVP